MITHDKTTWGITLNGFETSFNKNTIGTFKIPRSLARKFNITNATTQAQLDTIKEKTFTSIANQYIDCLLSVSKARILNTIPFNKLESDTRLALQDGVYGAIQHALLNNFIFEKLNASSLSTPNFSASVDTTNWLLQNDIFGMFVKNSINKSGIVDYEWVKEKELLTIQTSNGNTKIIGRANLDKLSNILQEVL